MLPDHIIIDFDSTFITSESLDELAINKFGNHPNGKKLLSKIQSLTNAGMNGDISFEESLEKRMRLLKINQNDIELLIKKLSQSITPSFKKINYFLQKTMSEY